MTDALNSLIGPSVSVSTFVSTHTVRLQITMAVANSTVLSKHPSNIMFEGPAQISKKKEMEAKHDLELERTKNKRELQVGYKLTNK